jgi:hypothetical protein
VNRTAYPTVNTPAKTWHATSSSATIPNGFTRRWATEPHKKLAPTTRISGRRPNNTNNIYPENAGQPSLSAGRRTVSPTRGDRCEPSDPDHHLEDHGCRPRSPTGDPTSCVNCRQQGPMRTHALTSGLLGDYLVAACAPRLPYFAAVPGSSLPEPCQAVRGHVGKAV